MTVRIGDRHSEVGPTCNLGQTRPRVLFVQDGSRRHYAVPVALAKTGMLECVFTEWYSPPGSLDRVVAGLVRRTKPVLGQKMLERYHPALPSALVRRNPWLLVRQEMARKHFASSTEFHRWRSSTVRRWVLRHGFGKANVLYGFVYNIDPALFGAARNEGLLTIGDQTNAPISVRLEEMHRQLSRWADWYPNPPPGRVSRRTDLERDTWTSLNHIVCGSPYVRDGLISEGVDPAMVTVVPHPSRIQDLEPQRKAASGGPVTVGFVGTVGLRKGAPYFVELARRFDRRHVRFVMVGAIDLSATGVSRAREVVDLIGPVPRSAVKDWLARFDLFYFPSTVEGSAGAVMEAMAAGLPVVTSPNSGSVIRDGQDGYIVPYDDLDQAEARIAGLAADPELRLRLGDAARQRAAEFDLDWYSAELAGLIEALYSRPHQDVAVLT